MIEYFASNVWQIWTIIAILCLILELSSGDFFIICFSIGAVFGAIASGIGLNIYWQLAFFALFTLISIFTVRPLALKYLHKKEDRPSNADALIGREGTVSESIEKNGYGRVAIDGDDWKALSHDGSGIEKGTKVKVLSRESIIITVERI